MRETEACSSVRDAAPMSFSKGYDAVGPVRRHQLLRPTRAGSDGTQRTVSSWASTSAAVHLGLDAESGQPVRADAARDWCAVLGVPLSATSGIRRIVKAVDDVSLLAPLTTTTSSFAWFLGRKQGATNRQQADAPRAEQRGALPDLSTPSSTARPSGAHQHGPARHRPGTVERRSRRNVGPVVRPGPHHPPPSYAFYVRERPARRRPGPSTCWPRLARHQVHQRQPARRASTPTRYEYYIGSPPAPTSSPSHPLTAHSSSRCWASAVDPDRHRSS